jgi:hypothetical protein
MKDTINKIKKKDTVILMGHMTDIGGLNQVNGKYGLGPRSQHGDILVEWCALNNMVTGA